MVLTELTDCTRKYELRSLGELFNLRSCIFQNSGMSYRVISEKPHKMLGKTTIFNRVLLCFLTFLKFEKPHSEITIKSCTTYKKCRHIRKNATGLPTLLYSSTYFIFYSWVKEQQHTNQHRISRLEVIQFNIQDSSLLTVKNRKIWIKSVRNWQSNQIRRQVLKVWAYLNFPIT